MRLLASGVLFLWASAAPAADWVDIPSPGSVMIQFDADSVVREGDVARAWDKAVHPRDQGAGSGDVAYRSVRTLMGYHCVLRTSLPLARVFFTEDGREIMRTNLEGVELSQPVVPDSPRARMLEKACEKKAPPPVPEAAAGQVTPEGTVVALAEPRQATPVASPKPRKARAKPVGDAKEAKPAAPGRENGPAMAAREGKPAKPGTEAAKGKTAEGRRAEPVAEAKSDRPEPRERAGKVHWTYDGKRDGPAAWHKLDPDFRLCSEGQRQSPIDIKEGVRLQLEGLKLDYKPFTLRIVDNGHTVQVTVPPGSTMTLGTKTYELLQFHFHKPSEERIAGKVYDMVAHFVHKSKDGRVAVLAVLFAPGPDHPVIQALWNHLPLESGRDEEIPGVKVDLNALLPKNRGYFTYMGSLTTPPCTEGVQWVVLKTPVLVSRGQVNIFGKLYAMNARPVQPAHGRLIKETL